MYNPRYIQFLASLLSSNTITHLFLTDYTAAKLVTASGSAPLLPLLLQHAHQFKEFMYSSQPAVTAIGHYQPLRLDTLLPLLTQCRRLTLSARNFSEDVAINPSLLPSLQYLDVDFRGFASPFILEEIVRARGGITLKEVLLDSDPNISGLWTDFIEICKEKQVELSIFDGELWSMTRGVLLAT